MARSQLEKSREGLLYIEERTCWIHHHLLRQLGGIRGPFPEDFRVASRTIPDDSSSLYGSAFFRYPLYLAWDREDRPAANLGSVVCMLEQRRAK